MRKAFLSIFCLALLLCSCDKDTYRFGRIDQVDPSLPVPSPVIVKDVRSTAGGAVIKVSIPDDDIIKGVVAIYERQGQEVNAKCSRYVDSLVVEGYADTAPHEVKVCSFNVNEVQSEPVFVTINPLTPAIATVTPTIFESFGGVKILIEGNESLSDLAVCLLRDENLEEEGKPVQDMRWVEVTTLFTASNNIKLTRRNLEPVEALYGVYIRDRWGNMSDTTVFRLTPWVEEAIDKSKFTNANLPDDNSHMVSSYYPIERLWDGSGSSEVTNGVYHLYASDNSCPMPQWVTIDLGAKVKLSRIATLPRQRYNIWTGAHVRNFEFWGSLNPTGEKNPENEHEFDDSWFLLGRFMQFKPSGYLANGLVGNTTAEDNEYFNNGNDFELDVNVAPRANDELRYLRCVFVHTFSTFELGASVGQVQVGEITPYGQVLEKYR